MDTLFSQLVLADVRQDVFRNIVSITASQDLFDDLSAAPGDWALAQQMEDAVKPPHYLSPTPVIHRPFEDAAWFNAIGWPFKHWQASRFSNGAFGVWYGCATPETSVYETAYHWQTGLLRDAGFEIDGVVAERKIYCVAVQGMLMDFRPHCHTEPRLVHKSDYAFTQSIGARLHRESQPGLLTHSARQSRGENFAVLNPNLLTDPRLHCHLTYRFNGSHIVVQKQVGKTWLKVDAEALAV